VVRKKIDRAVVAAELLPGAPLELLTDLHLLTRDGDLNADARRKVKQIRHLLQLLEPALADIIDRFPDVATIVDCGAGKSYLGFLLYVTRLRASHARVISIETRPELAVDGRQRAVRFACDRMEFVTGAIRDAPLPDRVHLVTALHACDTATDDAVVRGIRANADWIAVVPCCQAEVARQLVSRQAVDPTLAALCAHPWHRREFGSHLTNVIRALALSAHGYQVTVTELTGWEHSLKNELIIARRVQRFDRDAAAQLTDLCQRFAITPAVVAGLAADPPGSDGQISR
jgi:Methyltransferase domain